jgi:bacteriocin biosynthesis cyclodehydratase domain-containing protein
MHPKLKDSVELFPGSDGRLYLLSSATGDDYVIEHPSAAERTLLSSLERGAPWERLVSRVMQAVPAADEAELATALDGLIALDLVEDASDPGGDGLSSSELERYDRQLSYFGEFLPFGSSRRACQARLRGARVVVIGLGGIGSWALCGLASAGVGAIAGVDGDTVERSNLNRQILYGEADIGRSKVECAARALGRFNPHVTFEGHARTLQGEEQVAEVIAGADFVVEAADWPAHWISRWIDAACNRSGIPHISASQFPPFVRIGPTVLPGATACFGCREAAAREEHQLYDELVEFRAGRASRAATFGPATGLIGSLLAMEVVHQLAGVVKPATAGRALVVDVRTLSVDWEQSEPHPACCCGAARVHEGAAP